MSSTGSVQMSQGLDVLQPKSGPAYPIPCGEWDLLKAQAQRISVEPWFFRTIGSVFLGAALATFISILLGTFQGSDKSTASVVAWAVVSVTTLAGGLCMFFTHKERDVKRQRGSDLLTQMSLIEKRFERQPAQRTETTDGPA